MPGDSLWHRDVEYQEIPRQHGVTRKRAAKMLLARPLNRRQLMARQLRETDMAKNRAKPRPYGW